MYYVFWTKKSKYCRRCDCEGHTHFKIEAKAEPIQHLGHWMDLRGGKSNSILGTDPDVSLLRSVHTGCGVCPVSYSMTFKAQ